MYLPELWTAADGKKVSVWLPIDHDVYGTPILTRLAKFHTYIVKKRNYYNAPATWRLIHTKHFVRSFCTFGKIVMRRK